jgi:D-3-phosphoglycerate dehydrogenase
MDVVGFDPFISVASAWGLSRAVGRASGLDELFATSDYISLHVPLNDNTHHMISTSRLKSMKKGVRLLNFARGGLVDDDALLEAISGGSVAAYVTDFPEAKLLGVPQVLTIPHLGASTPEAEENCAVMAASQIADFLLSGTIQNSVNFPECKLQPSGNPRLLIVNRNIPNMVGQITTVLAGENINILDLLNRHRDEIAYTMIDMDQLPNEKVLADVSAIEGVVTHRVLTFD